MSQEGINSSTLNNECSAHKQHTQNNESNESSFNGFTRNHRRKRTKPSMVTDQQNYFDNDLNQSPPSLLINSQRPPSEEQPIPSSTDDNQLGSPASNLSSVKNNKTSLELAQDLSESGLKVVRRICDICQFESTDLEKFKTHIKFHSVALKCWYCHAVFAVAEFLKHHVDQCVNRGCIRDCSYCGQQFFDRESLLSHEYYFHHLARSATNEARQHVKVDSVSYQYRCPVCYEKVSSFERYQRHLDGHMNAGINEDGLECKLCRLTFLNQLSLQSHIASPRHREVAIRVKNLFRCYHCGTIFINRDTYAMHMLEIAREESHNSLAQKGIQGSIEQLQKTTDTAHPTTSEHNSTLNATNLVIKREKDDDGEYYSNNNSDFGDKFNPLAPLINVNESMKAVNLTLSGRAKSERDFPYKCHACDRQLVDQDMFAMHMLQHAKETANQKKTTTSVTTATPTTPSIKTEPTDAPLYETSRSDDYSAVSVLCSFCGSSFPSRDSLAMHVMIEHTNSRSSQNNNNDATGYTTLENLINSLYHDNNTGIRVARGVDASYSCPVCKQSAKDQDALAMHMLLHSHIPTSASRLDFSDSNPLSRSSPISMHDWQRSVLLALYKDQSSVGLQNLYSQRGDSSTRSNNDIEGQSNSYMDNGARRGSLADSEVTSTDTMSLVASRDIYSDTGELFDGNIIVYDKHSETWSCTVCKIDFRTLLYVTRHLGHVSHKLQVEKRLRAEMFTDGKSSGGDKSRGRATDVFSCGKCHAMFRSKHAYYRHFISSEHCRAFDNKNGDASPTKRLRLSLNEGPAATIQRPRYNGLKDAVSRQYEQHTPKRQVVRRRSSTQSAPCWSESEQSRVDIPSPMSVHSHRDISFLSPQAVRRQSTDTSVNMDVDDAKSRGSCTPQSDSTTDVLDFVLKQSVLLMCKFCQVIFCDRTMYYLHMGLHNHNNPWQCNLCGKVCNGVHEFSSHVIHYN